MPAHSLVGQWSMEARGCHALYSGIRCHLVGLANVVSSLISGPKCRKPSQRLYRLYFEKKMYSTFYYVGTTNEGTGYYCCNVWSQIYLNTTKTLKL
jgi:hypothetical protein